MVTIIVASESGASSDLQDQSVANFGSQRIVSNGALISVDRSDLLTRGGCQGSKKRPAEFRKTAARLKDGEGMLLLWVELGGCGSDRC